MESHKVQVGAGVLGWEVAFSRHPETCSSRIAHLSPMLLWAERAVSVATQAETSLEGMEAAPTAAWHHRQAASEGAEGAAFTTVAERVVLVAEAEAVLSVEDRHLEVAQEALEPAPGVLTGAVALGVVEPELAVAFSSIPGR